jgi:aldose sugar dehydrogenase
MLVSMTGYARLCMAAGLLLPLTLFAHSLVPAKAVEIYAADCASCHGTQLQGAQGPPLIAEKYIHGLDDDAIARSIRDGFPENGMPVWRDVLSEDDIRSLVKFIHEKRSENTLQHLREMDEEQIRSIPLGLMRTELENLRIEVIGKTGMPWGLAALPDGRLLLTEQQGVLRVIERGRLAAEPIKGTPLGDPRDRFHRLLLDVAGHPRFKENGWIYLTCGDSVQVDGKPLTAVSLVRGRINHNSWVDSKTLVQVPTDSTVTGRIAFDGAGHVFLTTASDAGVSQATGREPIPMEQLLRSAPQDLHDPNGKILRYNDDGTIPSDNPYVSTPGAFAAVWSYGHRNPEGLAFHPGTGQLWSSEHGPRGGDELNLIYKGHNYGWPVLSYGTRDDGISVGIEAQHEGMDQPIINWTPEVAVSAIAFYEGSEFPRWRDNLLVGTLVQRDLFRIVLLNEHAVLQEVILRNVGRIRAIAIGTDGDIYLALELRSQGLIVRIVRT